MLAGFYREHRIIVWILIVSIPTAILALGCLLAPQLFWNDFIYRYFWGPIVSDLEGRPVEGIAEGYNIVSTIVYALLLAGALYAMYRSLRRLRISMDLGLIVASLPIFLLGGVSRALEDALLFQGWLGYLFISPLIYALIGLFFVLAGAAGYFIRKRVRDEGRRSVCFGLFVIVLMTAYFLLTMILKSDLTYVLPFYLPLLVAAAVIACFHVLVSRGYEVLRVTILCTGILVLVVACLYVASFAFSAEWQAIFISVEGRTPELRPLEAVIIPGIAITLSAVIWVAGRAWPARIGFLALPTSFLMFLSHFLDGTATYRGVDLYGYGEKHVLPTALIDLVDTAAIMLLLKFLLVLVIVLLIDVLFRKDLEDHPGLGNVMKFAVIFLGMSPGIRDLVRISLGV